MGCHCLLRLTHCQPSKVAFVKAISIRYWKLTVNRRRINAHTCATGFCSIPPARPHGACSGAPYPIFPISFDGPTTPRGFCPRPGWPGLRVAEQTVPAGACPIGPHCPALGWAGLKGSSHPEGLTVASGRRSGHPSPSHPGSPWGHPPVRTSPTAPAPW